MSQILIENFKFLPDVLINKIINYTNVITYRDGKYIDKISKNDERYKLLDKISRPIKVGNKKVLLKLMNYSNYEPHGYFIEYIFDNNIKVTIKFMVRTTDGFDRLFVEKSNVKLIHDINNNLSIIIRQ
jgi:hypothetical protein